MPAPNPSNPTCQHCGSLLRKTGFTSAGLQMYRCKNGCSQNNGLALGVKPTGKAKTAAQRAKEYRDRKRNPMC